MRILDRYVLKSILQIFFLCLFTFFFLYIIIDLFSHLDVILENRVSITVLGRYYLTFLPVIFIQVTPFVCLLATLYTFAKLNHDNEIIAMRSSGLSIFFITKTAIVFGFILSVFIFWLNDKIAPSFRLQNERIRETMEQEQTARKNKEPQVLKNLTIYGAKNRLFYVQRFLTATNTMEGIVILEHDLKQNLIRKVVARQAVWRDNLWTFFNSITYVYDENGQLTADPLATEEQIMAITETPADFVNQRQTTDYMSLSQMEEYIWRLSMSGASTAIRNLKVDYYQRFTLPLMSLIIIMLAIPFSLKIRKKAAGLSSFGVSLVLGFLYYVLNAVSLALGKAGILFPVAAVSLSHAVMLIVSIYLIGTLP